jgi:hypothetical protein
MADPKTEAVAYRGEFVRSMGGGSISVEKITLVSGQNLKAGTVLGKITASGKYTILAPASELGQEVAAAVLWADCDASAADAPTTGLVRLAEAVGDLLTWPAGISGPEKTAAIAELAARNIIVR